MTFTEKFPTKSAVHQIAHRFTVTGSVIPSTRLVTTKVNNHEKSAIKAKLIVPHIFTWLASS